MKIVYTCLHQTMADMPCLICNGQMAPTAPGLAIPASPMPGCICPPGANKECEAPLCPRKGYGAGLSGLSQSPR